MTRKRLITVAALAVLALALAATIISSSGGEPRPETGGSMCDVGSFEVQP